MSHISLTTEYRANKALVVILQIKNLIQNSYMTVTLCNPSVLWTNSDNLYISNES